MRRRVSLLLAALLAGSTLVLLGPAQPASAMIVCTGAGPMTVAPGLLFPWLTGFLGQPAKDHDIDVLLRGPNTIHTFTMAMVGGVCTHFGIPPTVAPGTGTGLLKGFCTHASGIGTLNGQPFAFIHVGTFLFLTGHVVGSGTIAALPVVTGSCLHSEGPPPITPANPFRLATGGATAFTFALDAVGLNCPNSLSATETLTRLTATTLLTPPVGIHADLGFHLYTMSTCSTPRVLL